MLEQFSRDGGRAKLLAWFTLPRTLLDGVESRLRAVRGEAGRLSERELNDAMTAVAAAILQCCPLRRENLAELRLGPDHASGLGPNLYVPGARERNRAARIALADHEVKNNQGMTVLASDLATRALRLYRDRIRPEVLRRRGSDPSNPYLFPGRGRAERPHAKHTRDYRDRAWAAGFWLDLHCNRHLTAKIVLDRDPTAMPLVQTILGHANQRTTEAYYAEVNQILAQERFQQHLAAAESELTAELGTAIRSAQA
jgi:integrase